MRIKKEHEIYYLMCPHCGSPLIRMSEGLVFLIWVMHCERCKNDFSLYDILSANEQVAKRYISESATPAEMNSGFDVSREYEKLLNAANRSRDLKIQDIITV